ncbi:Uncharacterised protein [Mycobacterium tuberculosis]|nr:Uncharacterised protein [Mycobacterium tuberculosis]
MASRSAISAQPSAAAAARSTSVPALRDVRVQDQPAPILCHSTAPPIPCWSCSRPS